MRICKLSTMEVKFYKDFFPNTSFPVTIDNSFFIDQGYAIVNEFKNHDRETQRLEICDPYIENDEVFVVKVVDGPIIENIPTEILG